MKPAMSKVKRIEGVLSPVITPFRRDYAPDEERFVRHCRWLLKSGCAGLAIFGTNSEANSMSVGEKRRLLEALLKGGVSPGSLMPGTGHCALTDSIELTRAAVELGCAGVLMLPPFYYKGVSDEGLYRNFAEIIERVGDERLQLYLYHIPPVSQVAITLGLIERLLSKYPGIVAGVKDSSGDWSNTKAMLDAFAKEGFDVFAGSEAFLLENMRHGGKGCITATGNVNPGAIDRLYKSWRSPDADKLQAGISATRKIVQKQPMIPALKNIVAHYGNDAAWKTCRPPLVELTASQEEDLIRDLKGVGFTMPGLTI
jgi:4-hydroxy-tetrahydrodipicolinate synthase